MNEDEVDLSEIDSILAESDAELAENDPEKLQNVSKLASLMRRLEEEVETLEEKVSIAKAKIHILSTESIPAAMDEARLSEMVLDSGHRIKIEPFYNARLPKEDKDPDRHYEAVTWLEDNDYDSYLKNTVSTSFSKANNEDAIKALQLLKDQGFEAKRVSEVHWQSMNKIFKSQLESGDDFPVELFGAYHGRKTVIKET